MTQRYKQENNCRRRRRAYARCHQPMAAPNLMVNINEKMDSRRLVEAVRAIPTLYESSTKFYKNADKKAAHGQRLLQNWKSSIDAI